MAEDQEQRFFFPQATYPIVPQVTSLLPLSYPLITSPETVEENAPKFKYSRVWDKRKIQTLYSLANELCSQTRKSLNELDISDFAEISLKINQDPYKCMMKLREIMMSGTLKPGIWSQAEDEKLESLITSGMKKWGEIANILNKEIHQDLKIRTGKQAKERWNNHLNPEIDRGPWTLLQDKALLDAYKTFGNKWTLIVKAIPNRTESAVKNRVKSLMNKAKQDLKNIGNRDNLLDLLLDKINASILNSDSITPDSQIKEKITD